MFNSYFVLPSQYGPVFDYVPRFWLVLAFEPVAELVEPGSKLVALVTLRWLALVDSQIWRPF
jgi:hypothetical protein